MIGERIKELRLALNYSQVDLATKLSVTKQSISNWENNNIQPSIDILLKLSDFFGVTTDYILCREDIPRISITGLTEEQVQHIYSIIKDITDNKFQKSFDKLDS